MKLLLRVVTVVVLLFVPSVIFYHAVPPENFIRANLMFYGIVAGAVILSLYLNWLFMHD